MHPTRSSFGRVLSLLVLGSLSGCGEDSVAPPSGPGPTPPEASTWATIRDDIFVPRCANCHAEGTSFARQSDLVLTADVAYAQLVDMRANNTAARAAGLWRLDRRGLPSLYESYLWEKIDAPSQAHFYSDHPQYGALMPLGEPPLTNGELEYIRRWIVAGAPEAGDIVDRAVLDDPSRYEPPAFVPLAPPANGIQLHVSYSVAPGLDREVFWYEPLDLTEDRLIERVEISMAPGSHHFMLHTFRDGLPAPFQPAARVLRDVRRSSGSIDPAVALQMGYHQFFSGTQWPLLRYSFPPGVALRLPAGKGLDLNSHSVNRGTEPIEANVYANIHFADPGSVEHVADILFLSHEDIYLPPQRSTTLEATFLFSETVHIFQLFSHAHQTMRRFEVHAVGGARNGEFLYYANDWAHPPILQLDPPLDLQAGEGLRIVTTYENTTTEPIRWGLRSTDEMMMLFGYYWTDSGAPAQVVLDR